MGKMAAGGFGNAIEYVRDNQGDKVFLGRGSFGEVYKVKKGSQFFALKKIHSVSAEDKNEINILKQIRHGYIISYEDSWEEKGSLYILMEFANRGSLTSFVKNYEGGEDKWRRVMGAEYCVWRFIRHLASAFEFMHGKNIMHRDLKPDNILGVTQSDGNIRWKLADFGLSKIVFGSNPQMIYAHSLVGTPIYMAPEIYQRLMGISVETEKYTFSADMWSFGAVIWFFCHFGQHLRILQPDPFDAASKPIPRFYSDDLRNLVSRLLSHDPKQRPTAAELAKESQRSTGRQHDPLHQEFKCRNCSVNPIKGRHFKCKVCPNFFICDICFYKNVHSQHEMIVCESIWRPAQRDPDVGRFANLRI